MASKEGNGRLCPKWCILLTCTQNLYITIYKESDQQESDLRLTLFKMTRRIAQLLPWQNWPQGNNVEECYIWVSHAPIFCFFYFLKSFLFLTLTNFFFLLKVLNLSFLSHWVFHPESFTHIFHPESLSILVTLYLVEPQEVANMWLFFFLLTQMSVSHSLTKYVKPNF